MKLLITVSVINLNIVLLLEISRRYRSPIVTKDWLLDTIGTFDVKSIDSYLATSWLPRSNH